MDYGPCKIILNSMSHSKNGITMFIDPGSAALVPHHTLCICVEYWINNWKLKTKPASIY